MVSLRLGRKYNCIQEVMTSDISRRQEVEKKRRKKTGQSLIIIIEVVVEASSASSRSSGPSDVTIRVGSAGRTRNPRFRPVGW
jgi:hypothetical protein